MSRSIVTTSGEIVFRTKTVDPAQAQAFAKCLRANSRFCDVTVMDAARTKTPKAFITFRPVNAERQADLYMAQYNARVIRGYAEAGNYLFQQAEGFHFCLNLISGEVYEVHPFGCTCPDYVFRCSKAGILCKHCHAMQCQSDNDVLGQICPNDAPHGLTA